MRQIKGLTSSRIAQIASMLPGPFLKAIEHAARLGQGKGWGTVTIQAEVRACLQLLGYEASSPIVFDIGANVGDWTAEFLTRLPDSSLWAFEPSSAAFRSLERRFSSGNQVHTVEAAIGSCVGEAELWFDKPGSGLASLSRRRLDHIGLELGRSERVMTTTIDAFCQIHDVWPDVIKLDIEGHELDALLGAQVALEKASVVQFEFGGTNIDTRTFLQDFFYLFSGNGYGLHRLSPRGLEPVPVYRESDEVFMATNFFASRTNV